MGKTLWVKASPKGSLSVSNACAAAYIEAAAAKLGVVDEMSVWEHEFPAIDGEAALAKFAPIEGKRRTDEQKALWADVKSEIARVAEYDRVIVSCPMWNWSIPHALKAWIDVLIQPIETITLNEKGEHVGTLGQQKPLQLILTRSSAYDGRHAELQDFQKPYLEYVFKMLGYEVSTLVIEPTTRWTPEEREQMLTDAIATAAEAGAAI